MEINEIVKMQSDLDVAHGFPITFSTEKDKYDQITKDLVGLFGEIGEFSNVVKKMNIKLARPSEYVLDVENAESSLREELIDSLIYIIRIGAILEIDLQKEILRKIEINATRYESLRFE
jgi:NTP pyrophosphatase (non-canonical NTP hydrolase)